MKEKARKNNNNNRMYGVPIHLVAAERYVNNTKS